MTYSIKRINSSLRLLLLFTLISIAVTIPLSAAYFEFLDAEITNPDGTVINCFASGDEFFNWYHDKDGYSIIMGDDAYYYYGVEKGDGVVASEHRVGLVNPETVGLKKWAKISEKEYKRRRDFFLEQIERSEVRAPHSGTMLNLVVFIRFADDPEFSSARSGYDSRLNALGSTSLRDYYQNVSYEKLDIVSHFFPVHDNMDSNISYQDTKPRSYFRIYSSSNPNGYNGEAERKEREHSLLKRAVEYIEDQIPDDFVIDLDGDGYVDTMSFIIYGGSEGWAELLWAHRWVLNSFPVILKGKRVWDYTFQPTSQTDVKTLCHEMFHSLGAPDLYRYNQNGSPVGEWDIMERGFGHMGAWMKYRYANKTWVEEIPEITTSGTYSLAPLHQPENNAYMIRSAFSDSEIFVLEYRNKSARYESSLPGTGLLIYRINERLYGNSDGPPDEVYLYRPNGGNSGNGSINAAHYGAHVNRTAINDTNTNPKSFLSDDSNGGLYIYDIGHPEDDYITFSVTMIGVLEPPLLYQPIEDDIDVLVTPSFSWKRVNVAEKYELQIALDEDFEEIVFVDNEIEATDYDADTLLNLETEYYWRVRTFDGDDWSEWSSQRKFITTHFSPIEAEFTGVAYASTLWGDFDNDGYLDLFTSGNNITTIYQNKGDGDFEALPLVFPKLRFVAAALGDLNNDGYLDIVLTGRDQANAPCAYIFLNNGDDTFTELENNLEGVYNGSVDFGDFNNDGWLDILITGESKEGKSVAIYKNNGDYTYKKLDTENLPGITMGGAVWGDFDNDGWLDIAITGSSKNGSVSEIYLNDKGEGSFTKLDTYFTPLQGSCIDVADFDKDGFLDLALSGTTSGGLATYIYCNNGDGTFTDLGVDIPGYAVGNVKWGDLDSNGYPDLLLSGFTRTAIYRNVEGNFTLVNSGLPTLSLSSADWGDFDNDGDLDIVISGSALEGMVLTVYRNELGKNEFQPNTPPSAPENLTTVSNDSATTLSWDIAEDEETPADALTYNISIGTESGLEDILSSLSDLETGYRRVIKQGNNGSRLEYTIENLPPGTYYWRVQAIDSAFSGSPFSVEQEFSIEEDSAVEIPDSPFITELIGNYPNPFNPSTTVQFSLKNEEKVEIAVYNIAGQKIRTILNDTLESGKHTISWNGKTDNNKDVGSGIYFYKLTTQEKTQTKKMLLLK